MVGVGGAREASANVAVAGRGPVVEKIVRKGSDVTFRYHLPLPIIGVRVPCMTYRESKMTRDRTEQLTMHFSLMMLYSHNLFVFCNNSCAPKTNRLL